MLLSIFSENLRFSRHLLRPPRRSSIFNECSLWYSCGHISIFQRASVHKSRVHRQSRNWWQRFLPPSTSICLLFESRNDKEGWCSNSNIHHSWPRFFNPYEWLFRFILPHPIMWPLGYTWSQKALFGVWPNHLENRCGHLRCAINGFELRMSIIRRSRFGFCSDACRCGTDGVWNSIGVLIHYIGDGQLCGFR